MGIRTEEFPKYKDLYKEILERYDLYENEDDLFEI